MACGSRDTHAAPVPRRTAGIVLMSILRSSERDQLSMYMRSCLIQYENVVLLRPFTCHKQVRPGFTLKRRISDALSNLETSRLGKGLGPTKEIGRASCRESA